AIQDVREQVDIVRQELPDDVDDPYSMEYDPTEMPVLEYGLTSSEMDLAELREFADDELSSRLESLKGIASVDISGGLEREIQVYLDQAKLKGYSVNVNDVMDSIAASNQDLPGGDINPQEKEHLQIRTLGEIEELEELNNVMVPGKNNTYYLEDIARIEDDYKDREQYTWINGEESVGLSLQKEAEANTVQTAELVKKEIEKIESENDRDVNFSSIYDESNYVNLAIGAVVNNAIVGGILAVIILFIFLANIPTTVIIALSIPISIITTFVMLFFADMNLNIMSMGGLALGTGMLVDNAIVVLENIYRFRLEGSGAFNSAVEGTNEVRGAITASTITTLIVFLPVVFIEGIAGEIFSDLSFTVTFALLISLFVAITLIAMLSSKLLKNVEVEKLIEKQENSFINRFLNKIKNHYQRWLNIVLDNRTKSFLLVIVIFAVSFFPFIKLSTEFLPEMDEGQIQIQLEMPKGTPRHRTENIVKHIEKKVQNIPELRTMESVVGLGGREDKGEFTIRLVELDNRNRSTSEIIESLRSDIENIDAAENIEISPISNLTGGEEGMGDYPIQLDILGDDREELEDLAKKVAKRVEDIPGTREVSTGIPRKRPEIQLNIDRRKAGKYGLTPGQTANLVDTAVKGNVVSRYQENNENIDIRVRYGGDIRQDLHSFNQTPIPTATGEIIPLTDVAKPERGESPGEINRIDQNNSMSVYSQLHGASMGEVTTAIEEELKKMNLPDDIDYEFGSETEWMNDAFEDLSLAITLAIILVYMVIASQFESFIQPFIILFSVPFGLVGVVWALFITGKTLNVASFIGMIMLVGIVVNNAIVLLDYINQLQKRYDSRREAILNAGKVRLRPIFMTASTTMLAMLPLSLGIGEGSEIQAPIAISVIGGLLISTFATLFIIPMMFTLFEDLLNKIKGN
ncbi:MAG: efflux RND transporter permease subunit, partial [Bacteroidales bacterium]